MSNVDLATLSNSKKDSIPSDDDFIVVVSFHKISDRSDSLSHGVAVGYERVCLPMIDVVSPGQVIENKLRNADIFMKGIACGYQALCSNKNVKPVLQGDELPWAFHQIHEAVRSSVYPVSKCLSENKLLSQR